MEHFSCDISCVYTSCKVGSYFSLKCQTPAALVSNVVYKFTCLRDANLFYIGKTKRHFDTRVAEHLNLTSERPTAVADHVSVCSACQTCHLKDNFKIIKKCNSDFDCQIHEALLIQKLNPKLNVQLFNSGASYKLLVFA